MYVLPTWCACVVVCVVSVSLVCRVLVSARSPEVSTLPLGSFAKPQTNSQAVFARLSVLLTKKTTLLVDRQARHLRAPLCQVRTGESSKKHGTPNWSLLFLTVVITLSWAPIKSHIIFAAVLSVGGGDSHGGQPQTFQHRFHIHLERSPTLRVCHMQDHNQRPVRTEHQ